MLNFARLFALAWFALIAGCAVVSNLQLRAQLRQNGAEITVLRREKATVIRLVSPKPRDYRQLYDHYVQCRKSVVRISILARNERYAR